MKLIRENKEKQRAVFLLDNGLYRKYWYNQTAEWINGHVALLNKCVPDYVNASGDNWIEFNPVPGTLASTYKHTPEFVQLIYNFCLDNIKQTMPYSHGDWALSNMLIDNGTIRMCDWDNIGVRNADDVLAKLTSDLSDAFGELFTRSICSTQERP